MKSIVILLSVALALTSCAPVAPVLGTAQSQSNANSASISGSIPNFDHIVLIMLENRDYTEVIGNSQMPHLNTLAQRYVLLSNYFAVGHPSLPNYLALMSGSTQNVTQDCTDCFINQPNLADRIEAGGRTWKSYLEDMPSPCFIGDKPPYYQNQNPLIYFDSIRLDSARCKRSIVPLTNLDADLAANQLPNFSLVMPNICNSGDQCQSHTTDNWVNDMVTKLQASPALGEKSLIIIAFDEANEHNNGSCCGLGDKGGGQIPAILISPQALPTFNDKTAYSHYSILKLILSAWKLPDLGLSASAPQILAPWETSLASEPSTNQSAPAQPTIIQTNVIPTQPKPTSTTDCTNSSSSSTSGSKSYTVTVCFVDITDGATLAGDSTITATVSTSDLAPGVQRMVFYLDGAYLLTDYQSPYSFTLPTSKWADGSHVLAVEALLRDNFTSKQSKLSVSFTNGVATPQANTAKFQPSTGIPAANGQPFIVVAGGDGAGGETNATNVSNLIASINPNLFLYLGDVYEKGSPTEFYNWYGGPNGTFGRFRAITDPTVGNHEYLTNGAAGYFDYWNNIPNYYSFNAGGWHFISLNSNPSGEPVDASSAQYRWLSKDLSENVGACIIAYYHHPLFNIGDEGSSAYMQPIWNLLARNKVAIVLNGHDHDYQRWVPLNGSGQPDPNGVTEFVAGATGHGLQTFTRTDKRVAYSNDENPKAFGILVFQLNSNSANFSYRNTKGATLDSGVVPCPSSASADTQMPIKPGSLSATVEGATKAEIAWPALSENSPQLVVELK